jgi:hypothetical protein
MGNERNISWRISNFSEIIWVTQISNPVLLMDESVYLQHSEKYIQIGSSNDAWFIFKDRYVPTLPRDPRAKRGGNY